MANLANLRLSLVLSSSYQNQSGAPISGCPTCPYGGALSPLDRPSSALRRPRKWRALQNSSLPSLTINRACTSAIIRPLKSACSKTSRAFWYLKILLDRHHVAFAHFVFLNLSRRECIRVLATAELGVESAHDSHSLSQTQKHLPELWQAPA
jgi:hypothetical protein